MERFIEIPNLPANRVSLVVTDGRIGKEIEDTLISLDIKIIKTMGVPGLYEAVSYHPDIMLHHLGENRIIVAPNLHNKFVYELEDNGFTIITGKREIGFKYPFNVAYNAARVGNCLICNSKYTDELLLELAYSMELKIINVNQGYSKCSICVVDKKAIITSDPGIFQSLLVVGIDCCLVNTGDIELLNMNYGFIGGASGYISGGRLGFYGDISLHQSHDKILRFLIKYGKKPLNLSKNKINDFGTLIPLKEYSILTK